MIKLILAGAASATLLFVGCQKDKSSGADSNTTTESCISGRSAVNGGAIEGQYIVLYKNTEGGRVVSEGRAAERSLTILQENNIGKSAIEASFGGQNGGFVAKLTQDEVIKLRADDDIQAIEPDRIFSLSTCFTVVEPKLVTWNISRVGYGDGTGKTAWIIDSGIDPDHPDLNVDATRSRSFVNGETSYDDANGHGTHVAGVIGAKNNTIGVLGIASNASLVSLRVLDKNGAGRLSYILQALSHVYNNGKAGDVVNLSVGEDSTSDIFDQQVKAVASKGIFVAIAAGNDGKNAKNFSPARVNATNVYTVSAVDSLDNFASFSNYGNEAVDYAAPGVRILSTYSDGRYAKLSGTSMAAPHVAGLLLVTGGKLSSSGSAKNDPDGSPDPIVHK